MGKSTDFRDNRDSPLIDAWRRWVHAITGHYMFLVFLGGLHWIGSVPALWLLILFLNTGNWIYAAGFAVLAGIPGVIWTAMHRTVWTLQFGFPVYLFKELWKNIRQSFRQGWQLGMLFAFLWGIVFAPVYAAQQYGQTLPFGIVCLMTICALLLCVISSYTYYQISRYVLSIGAALRNSILLLINIGWRSAVVCLIWIAFVCGVLLAGQIVLPVCMFCGLTVILCAAEQAFFVPCIDKLLNSQQ